MNDKDIEERVGLTLAVGRYLQSSKRFDQASKKFNQASKDFTASCDNLREKLGDKKQRFVVQIDFNHYVVESDQNGSFNVEPISCL